ncbi:hypothetical protein [Neorhizobium sp. SOG26]|uniref:hypothetical protein n=1 Tax=Neorhizobium sp. SOG26 TaxID=2060726 RepID=UPI001FE22314|nr:hypothetical protein [Neorhizobium sp. SOG26]
MIYVACTSTRFISIYPVAIHDRFFALSDPEYAILQVTTFAVDAGVGQRQRSEALDLATFNQMAEFIYRYSGIKMPSNKITMLEGRLRRGTKGRT